MSVKDTSKLDLVFLLDCTSSMGPYIDSAKKNINKIADDIIKSESCHLRLALTCYRDHPPQDNTYVTQVNDFTDDITVAKTFISNAQAHGGGDLAESICCALYESLYSLAWRDDAVKVAILIADAPPHGIGSMGDSMPHGCPDLNDPVEIVHKMAEKSITLYCAGCEPALVPYRQFFIALSLITGGKYIPLDNADQLTQIIVGGTREEISMEKLMAQVHDEVMKEAAASGKRVDEDVLTTRIHNLLNSQGSKINAVSASSDIKIEEGVKEMSKTKTLSDLLKCADANKVELGKSSYTASLICSRVAKPFGGSYLSSRYKKYYGKKKYDYDWDEDEEEEDDYGYRGYGKKRKRSSYASSRGRKAKKPSKAAIAALPFVPISVPIVDTSTATASTGMALRTRRGAAASATLTPVASATPSTRSKTLKKGATDTASPATTVPSTPVVAPTTTTTASAAATPIAAAAAAATVTPATIGDSSKADTINLDQARRMVKKAIARNKLN